MAANKFATSLHRRTNKITLVLVYAFLEWVLIFFLLLNSLFSYLIIKLADYFGLQKPCLWCSRLDHVFEPSKFHNSHRSLICEAHSLEISKLDYCLNHRKLAESRDMCVDCKFSAPGENSKKLMMNKLGVNSVLISKCSCCGERLEKSPFSPNGYLIKPFWLNSILEGEIQDQEVYFDGKRLEGNYDEDKNREEKKEEIVTYSVSSLDCSEMAADLAMEKEGELPKKDNENLCKNGEVIVEAREMSSEIETRHLDFFIDQDACHLIAIEPTKNLGMNEREEHGDEDFVMEFDDKNIGTQYNMILKDRCNLQEKLPLLPILECEEDALIAELEAIELNETNHFEDFQIEQFPIQSIQPIQREMEDSRQDEEDTEEIEHLLYTEESIDGSEIEKLKMALKEERKALNEVYEELEEERRCSAEAANQTMAMINRLQQEKAVILMEALQYQRIMEQQSEYDHQTLQKMNQLMVKYENELQFFRNKVRDYEARDKLKRIEDKSDGVFEYIPFISCFFLLLFVYENQQVLDS